MAKQRLQKIMAAAGIASRRDCEEIIEQGQVQVNGEFISELPAFADPDKDDIRVSGQKLKMPDKVYFLVNKPKGYICTNRDPHKRPKVIDLVDTKERVYCVGRLDADSTGAIVLTNDNELTNKLTHPRYELAKTYQLRIRGNVDSEAIEKIKKGVWLSEGKTNRASVKVLKRTKGHTHIQIVIKQGLNRQLRRTFARIGYKVQHLHRTNIGNISIKGVPAGGYKKLSKSQIQYLKNKTGPKKRSKKNMPR
jgi:23S rRNA pseudouridine2605 synthase